MAAWPQWRRPAETARRRAPSSSRAADLVALGQERSSHLPQAPAEHRPLGAAASARRGEKDGPASCSSDHHYLTLAGWRPLPWPGAISACDPVVSDDQLAFERSRQTKRGESEPGRRGDALPPAPLAHRCALAGDGIDAEERSAECNPQEDVRERKRQVRRRADDQRVRISPRMLVRDQPDHTARDARRRRRGFPSYVVTKRASAITALRAPALPPPQRTPASSPQAGRRSPHREERCPSGPIGAATWPPAPLSRGPAGYPRPRLRPRVWRLRT